MSTEPLNTIAIQQFIKAVQSAENGRAREVRMDIAQAKNLAFTLGIVMSRLEGDLEKLLANNKSTNDQEIIIKMDSGSNW
jgi:hypothetical protein